MRVTTAATFRNFTSNINNTHSNLIKSFNKVSSQNAYESAAENPLAYYEGLIMDNQYQDLQTKLSLSTDIRHRLYQQELGIRSIQTSLTTDGNTTDGMGVMALVMQAKTATTKDPSALDSISSDLIQKVQSMVDSLNIQYENMYVFGGNDVSSPPFSISEDGMTLTYKHQFPGESDVTEMKLELKETPVGSGNYEYDFDSDPNLMDNIIRSMSEQGTMDLGYGYIGDRDSLIDTFTGGLNALTGITSRTVREKMAAGQQGEDEIKAQIKEALNKNAIALSARSAHAIQGYIEKADSADASDAATTLDSVLGDTLNDITISSQNLSRGYIELGNKYKRLEDTETRMEKISDELYTAYNDKLKIDPYEAIMEVMYNQYSYNAALQVGSKLMGSSLFDFMS